MASEYVHVSIIAFCAGEASEIFENILASSDLGLKNNQNSSGVILMLIFCSRLLFEYHIRCPRNFGACYFERHGQTPLLTVFKE